MSDINPERGPNFDLLKDAIERAGKGLYQRIPGLFPHTLVIREQDEISHTPVIERPLTGLAVPELLRKEFTLQFDAGRTNDNYGGSIFVATATRDRVNLWAVNRSAKVIAASARGRILRDETGFLPEFLRIESLGGISLDPKEKTLFEPELQGNYPLALGFMQKRYQQDDFKTIFFLDTVAPKPESQVK